MPGAKAPGSRRATSIAIPPAASEARGRRDGKFFGGPFPGAFAPGRVLSPLRGWDFGAGTSGLGLRGWDFGALLENRTLTRGG